MPDSAERKRRDPDASRMALIEATLDSIAEDGLTETTVSNIIARAGLSRGMVHLHFGSKDKLLGEAAQVFSARYYAAMDRMLGPDPMSPEARVMTIVAADLSPVLLNRRDASIWHAFRGAASSQPQIARYSSIQDDRLVAELRQALEALCPAGPEASQLAGDATYGTLCLLEGMWVHYMTDPARFSRTDSFLLVRRLLAGLFPGRFTGADTLPEALPRSVSEVFGEDDRRSGSFATG